MTTMDSLVVRSSDSWTLVLRWPPRRAVAAESPTGSTLRIQAVGHVTVILPSGETVEGSDTVEVAVPPMLWEPPRLQVSFERMGEASSALTVDHPDPRVRMAITDPTGRGRSCSGALDLSERVGFLELGFRAGSTELVRIRVEVFPSKLDYRRDLLLMLTELAATRPSDAVALLTRTHVKSALARRPERSLEERFQIIDALFPRLERAMRLIARQPHAGLAASERARAIERLRRPDGNTLRAARQATRREVFSGGVALPRMLPDAHRVPTWDTTPNRYVQAALRSLDHLLVLAARRRLRTKEVWADETLQLRVAARRARTRAWLAQDFLREARARPSEPDLAMERSPGYRDFLRAWRTMLLAYTLLGEGLTLDLADLDRLYEIWCEERLKGLLSELLGAPAAGPSPAHPSWRFPGGTRFLVKPAVREPDGGPEHEPDFGIELPRPAPRAAGGLSHFLFLFDAKYRLGWDEHGKPRPVQDAVNAMHRYRDAMVFEEDTQVLREVYGGAILFPHPSESSFGAQAESAWTRMAKTGIGAIPLTPSGDHLLRAWLAELVHASAVRLDRFGPRYRPLPPPRRTGTVLLAHVPYGEPQIAQVVAERWLHLYAGLDLASRKPSHVALLEPALGGFGSVRRLFPILGWSEVGGDEIRRRARFGDGKAGHRPRYTLLDLGPVEFVEPAIDGSDWWPHGSAYVPLEVFDLADSTWLLRGDERDAALIRVIHHLRRTVTGAPPSGWLLREPVLVGRRWFGELEASAVGVRWRVGGASGECTLAAVRRGPVGALLEPLREAVRRVAGGV